MNDRWEVSRTDLAKLLKVTGQTITHAVDAGAPVKDRGAKGKPSRYDAAEFLAWWIENEKRKVRDEGRAKKGGDTGDDLDNEIKREKLAQLRREYVPRTVLAEVLRDTFTRLRVALDRFPTRHASKCVGLADELAALPVLTSIAAEMKGELRDPREWAAPESEEQAA